MQPNLVNTIRDGVAYIFCCGNTAASTGERPAPIAASLQAISNASRTTGGVANDASSKDSIVLNDDDKKNIILQFHRGLTRSRFSGSTTRQVSETAQTLAALSLVDRSWREASKEALAVTQVNGLVLRDFNDNFDMPIKAIQYIDSKIQDATLRGQAALTIVDAALRRSVGEEDFYNRFDRPETQRQSFPYADILRGVIDLPNVQPKLMNLIIAMACNVYWGGPTVFALGIHDYDRLGFSTALLDKMLGHVENDLADACSRARPLLLRSPNIIGRGRPSAKWPTLSEMTKVAAGIQLREGEHAAHVALGKILDCIQRAPLEHRVTTMVGVAAYADAFLDRRAYEPFVDGTAIHAGERTVDFIFANIQQRLSTGDFGTFLDQLTAQSTIHDDVKARAHHV